MEGNWRVSSSRSLAFIQRVQSFVNKSKKNQDKHNVGDGRLVEKAKVESIEEACVDSAQSQEQSL